jgi:preprotein translocase subunit YajC
MVNGLQNSIVIIIIVVIFRFIIPRRRDASMRAPPALTAREII